MAKRSVTLEIELEPFVVPDKAHQKAPAPDPTKPPVTGIARRLDLISYPLGVLDETTLEALCEEFTDAVFEKAGKVRPVK